jgi:hypothetical protein
VFFLLLSKFVFDNSYESDQKEKNTKIGIGQTQSQVQGQSQGKTTKEINEAKELVNCTFK